MFVSGRLSEASLPRPGFRRSESGKILMRPDVVVKEAELGEGAVERFERIDREPIEPRLERAEETLDPPVLPRAAGIGSLVPDAEDHQREAKRPRNEDGFVVRSDRLRLAVAADRFDEFYDQHPALCFERLQLQRRAARVLEDAKDDPRRSIERHLAAEIERPDD